MNKFLNDLERRLGRYAVPRLTFFLIVCYIIGYMFEQISPQVINYMTLEPYRILHGEVWRLVTWILITPFGSGSGGFRVFFTIITMIIYLSIGTALERTWGDFRYNVYIFSGLIFTVLAAFISYFIFSAYYHTTELGIGNAFTTYYIMVSIFLAYGATFPEAQVLLYFVIPVKIKYLAWIYGAYIAYDAVTYIRLIAGGQPIYAVFIISMLASLLNFVIFFITNPRHSHLSPEAIRRRRKFDKEMKAGRRDFQENVRRTREDASDRNGEWNSDRRGSYGQRTDWNADHRGSFTQNGSAGGAVYGSRDAWSSQGQAPKVTPIQVTRHKCTICGRTEVSDPDLEFRFCSKCDGDHEYCMDHLYTHEHIRSASEGDQTEL